MTRYYWIQYNEVIFNTPYYREICTDLHPFTFIKEIKKNKDYRRYYELQNWKSIDVEEYNLYNQLNNHD